MLEQHPTTPSTGAGPSRSPNPSGTRKRDRAYLDALRCANEWCGLPEGTDRFTITRALKKHDVAARLGWSPHQVFLTETLIGVTTARDWKDSSRPMVWLSQDALKELFSCKSDSNVRYHLRRLMELGVLAMRDSTNCHRKVHYDPKTGERIPFGLDLSPIAALLPRVLQTAEDAEEEHHTHRLLRQQIKSLRKSNKETLEQAIEDGRLSVDDPATRRLQSRIEALWPTTALTRLPLSALCELRHDAETLEADLVAALTSMPPSAPPDEFSAAPNLDGKPTNICCLTSENSPQPITITNESEIEIPVAAGPEPSTLSRPEAPPAARPGPEREEGSRRASRNSKAPPGWLILEALPPSFAAHLPEGAEPTSTDFQAAANLTRSRLGVSPSAWREACQQLSPDGAALAIAVVASRSDAGEIRSAGGYLRGMLDAARKGELDLSKSLWGMVDRLPLAAPGTETAPSPPPACPDPDPHCSAAARPGTRYRPGRDRRSPGNASRSSRTLPGGAGAHRSREYPEPARPSLRRTAPMAPPDARGDDRMPPDAIRLRPGLAWRNGYSRPAQNDGHRRDRRRHCRAAPRPFRGRPGIDIPASRPGRGCSARFTRPPCPAPATARPRLPGAHRPPRTTADTTAKQQRNRFRRAGAAPMRRRYRAQFPDVLEPVSTHELDPAGNRWHTLDEIEDIHGFVRWELDADRPSALWGWAWLIDRTRYLATTRHVPGRIIRTRHETQRGTAT